MIILFTFFLTTDLSLLVLMRVLLGRGLYTLRSGEEREESLASSLVLLTTVKRSRTSRNLILQQTVAECLLSPGGDSSAGWPSSDLRQILSISRKLCNLTTRDYTHSDWVASRVKWLISVSISILWTLIITFICKSSGELCDTCWLAEVKLKSDTGHTRHFNIASSRIQTIQETYKLEEDPVPGYWFNTDQELGLAEINTSHHCYPERWESSQLLYWLRRGEGRRVSC